MFECKYFKLLVIIVEEVMSAAGFNEYKKQAQQLYQTEQR